MQPQPLLLLLCAGSLYGPCLAADPTFSPATITDSAGNSADSSAAITWADLPSVSAYAAGYPERVSEGLSTFYTMVHGFIDFVFMKGIPKDIVEKAANGNLGDIPSNYSEYTSYIIGYGICVVIGFLFMIIFPIVGCCFCCCRCCCGKCGGKMDQSEREAANSCRKFAYAILLACVLAFLVTGAACIYVNNDNTSETLEGIATTTDQNLDDVRTYVNNTVDQVNHLVVTNFNFLKDVLFRDLDNIAYLAGLPLRTTIENSTGIRTTLANAYALDTDINAADTAMADVETKVSDLDTSLTALNTALTNWKTNTDAVFAACGTCSGQPTYSGLNTGVDSANLPDLSAARTSMNSFTATNLTAKIVDAEAELDSIPETVSNDSLSVRNSLKSTIANLSDEIDPVTNEVNKIQDHISGDNATIDLDNISDKVDEYSDLLEKYDKYRWQGGLGLACIVLLVIVLAAIGLTCGILGSCSETPPSKRGFVSNLGGICLMASVGFVFIFSVLLMLLTTLPFLFGAPMHAFVCKPIADLDYMDELWTIFNDAKVGAGNYYLGDVIHDNKSIALTLPGILRDCKAGKSALQAFKLDTRFDLTDLLNYSKTLDVQSEIDQVNVDFSGVTVYPTDLQTQLTDAKSALDVNFTAFYAELNKDKTTMNLTTLADDLDTFAGSLTGAASAHKVPIQNQASALRTIETVQYADTEAKVTALNTSVASLETAIGTLPTKLHVYISKLFYYRGEPYMYLLRKNEVTQIDDLDSGLVATDNFITNNASDAVKSVLTTYANRIIGIVDAFKDFTLDAIQTKMGSCSPVWNVYNTMLVYTFCYNIMDTFNGFWFSLGWCVFFFMPGIIFSVKLARFFRRMNDANSNRISPMGDKSNGIYPDGPNVAMVNPDISQRKFNASQFSSDGFEGNLANGNLAASSADLSQPPFWLTTGDHATPLPSSYTMATAPQPTSNTMAATPPNGNHTMATAPPPNSYQLYGKPNTPDVAVEMNNELQNQSPPGYSEDSKETASTEPDNQTRGNSSADTANESSDNVGKTVENNPSVNSHRIEMDNDNDRGNAVDLPANQDSTNVKEAECSKGHSPTTCDNMTANAEDTTVSSSDVIPAEPESMASEKDEELSDGGVKIVNQESISPVQPDNMSISGEHQQNETKGGNDTLDADKEVREDKSPSVADIDVIDINSGPTDDSRFDNNVLHINVQNDRQHTPDGYGELHRGESGCSEDLVKVDM